MFSHHMHMSSFLIQILQGRTKDVQGDPATKKQHACLYIALPAKFLGNLRDNISTKGLIAHLKAVPNLKFCVVSPKLICVFFAKMHPQTPMGLAHKVPVARIGAQTT